jgi:tetratricopeptide (TPR) repeat protein
VDSATLVEKAKLLYEKDKLLVLAALDDEAKLKVDIATWVRNAKFLYHMGKYDDAEAVLGAVMNKDPANQSAAYYLDLIKEARYMDRARRRAADVKRSVGIAEWGWDYTSSTNRSSHSMPYPIWNTNLVYTTKGRQHIISKLNNIMLDEVSFDLPLKDVLLKLRKESQKHDPDGVGINFMIQNVPGPTPGAQKDIGTDVRIKLSPPLQKLRMADVLDAITKVADSPIRYMVEDYAVVFSPKPLEAESLYTKSFRVDPNTFSQGLQNVTGVRLNLGAQAAAGGATIPQVTIGFDTQQGGIQASQTGAGGGQNGLSYVTRTNSTIEAHQLVAAYFAANGVILDPPKSVFFNDRLGEILVRASLDDLDKIQQSIELLNQTPPQVTIEAQFIEVDEAALQGLALDWNKPAQEFTGTMTAAQFRSALTAIEQHTSADVLSTPRVTTESGRQAHLGSSNGDEGVTLDVLPVVKPDGYFIQITASPAITVGHQTWQVKASGQVLDSQTMVIGGVVTNQLSGPKKVGVVFVTPTIIDPAGNRVHTDDDLAKPRKSGDQVQ